MGSPKVDQAAGLQPGGMWVGGRKQASPGLEEMPELQPRPQVHYWHLEDAQDWTIKEDAALGGDKSEDTVKLTQHYRCTVIDPGCPADLLIPHPRPLSPPRNTHRQALSSL